jgi:hypothetical protein
MATNKNTLGNESGCFKQIESDSWTSIYLPAICAGVIMTIVLFVAIACSKKSDSSANKISAPMQPEVSTPAPATAAATTPAAPKKVRKQRPTNATFVNSAYGVSFSYPRKYSLAAGNSKPSAVKAGFLKPGAVQIAAVDMPDSSYPETDFSSAVLNVSVNPNLTSDECTQFTESADKDSAKPSAVKVGANQFTAVEQMNGEMTHQSDLKYYHLFKNGACYEFALDVETSRKPDDELAQVDRGQVFKQLQKMLTSARIKEVDLAAGDKTETQAVTAKTGDSAVTSLDTKASSEAKADSGATPAAESTTEKAKTEKAQVATPVQK